MTHAETPEHYMQAARDRGKVLRCRPCDPDVDRMDFVRIHGSVLTDRYAGYVPEEEAAHVYRAEEVRDHLSATLRDGEVLTVNQENTRWGELNYGSE